MAGYAEMRVLDIWYHRINFEPLVSKIPGLKYRELTSKEIDQATRNSVADRIFPTLVRRKGKSPLIKDHSPLIFHETGRQRALYPRSNCLAVARGRSTALWETACHYSLPTNLLETTEVSSLSRGCLSGRQV
jgi:hypothetical protein